MDSKGQNHLAVNEATPLLSDAENGIIIYGNGVVSGSQRETDKENNPPLPKTQIFILCYARLIEPVAFFSIFPFINKMILEVGGVDEADVGFYSGLIESLFSLAQMVLMISWGRAADRLGRKPVLVCSLVGVAFATALFGSSKTLWQVIFFRCLAGVFAGTVLTVRTMISENSTPKTQAEAFGFFVFSGNMGMFLGPLIGGSLADPASQYPKVFGKIEFFREYPYALATFATGAIALSAAIITMIFIKETLVRDKSTERSGVHAAMSTWELARYPGIPNVLLIYGMIMLLALAYTAVAPVFWFTRPELGGYGFSPVWISNFLGAAGILQAVWVLVIFPTLQHRIGTGGILRFCSYGFPVVYALSPLTNLLLRKDFPVAFWVLTPVLQILSSATSMSACMQTLQVFPGLSLIVIAAIQLAINDIAPTPSTLGTLNALSLAIMSGIRAIVPALFTSIFATGTRTQALGGYLVWLILVLLALATALAVKWLPEKAEGRLEGSKRSD